jgi:hypothetical protein
MFFMGGMTMGYLHPPVPAKETEAVAVSLPKDKSGRPIDTVGMDGSRESAAERTLLWARRILC